jgi:hypothetical protein
VVYIDGFNLLCEHVSTVKKNTATTLSDGNVKANIEVNTKKLSGPTCS